MASRHRSSSLTGSEPAAPADPDRRQMRQALLVGRNIRRLRKERRLEQADLAAMVGLQPADLARVERGEYRISLDVLFRLLGVFEASVDDFLSAT